MADFMPPFELFTRILGPEGGRRRLLQRLGPDAAEPIEAFLAQALAYEEAIRPRSKASSTGSASMPRARNATWSRGRTPSG
jgi:hypothetical protein